MKDWLTYENARNKSNAALYVRLLRRAFADKADLQVMIGHHLTIEYEGRLETEDEIPSADTMMFDHDIMKKAFGDMHRQIMAELALVPCDRRDAMLTMLLDHVEGKHDIHPSVP